MRHVVGVAVGVVGTVVTLWLLAGASDVAARSVGPGSSEEAAFTALYTLAGGTVLGGVLLVGRRLSPSAPLSSGLLWAAASLVTLADPDLLLAGLGPGGILPQVAYQLGLALAAVMLLGTLAVQSPRPRPEPGRRPVVPRDERDTDRDLPVVGPGAVHRGAGRGRRRPDGAGPRHRASAGTPHAPSLVGRRPPVPQQRRMPPPRRTGAVPPPGPMPVPRRWR